MNNIIININLEYSAKKIKVKFPLLYSILNPEINSDSLSDKSKGVRLISAIILQKISIIKGKFKVKNKIFLFNELIFIKLIEFNINIIIKIEIEKVTS